ncbi:MAG: hypothetical protein ACJ795_05480 [Ktedonobacteraceae bacterium]
MPVPAGDISVSPGDQDWKTVVKGGEPLETFVASHQQTKVFAMINRL